MTVHACNPSNQVAGARRFSVLGHLGAAKQIPGQPDLHCKIMPQNKTGEDVTQW